MNSKSWRRAAPAMGLALMLAVALAGAARADDVATTLTLRMKHTRSLVVHLTGALAIHAMRLAPDGKHLAAIVWDGVANRLLLIDTDTLASHALVEPESKRWDVRGIIQPVDVHWIDDHRLAVDFNEGQCNVVGFDGRRGLVLGGQFHSLVAPDKPGEPAQWAIVASLGVFRDIQFRRVNVNTGESVDIPLDLPGDVLRTVFDRAGRLRAAQTLETKWLRPGAKLTNWYRHDERSPWQMVAQGAVTDDLWTPIGVPGDADTLVVLSREGRDTRAMFTFDVASRRITDLRAGHPTEDLIDVGDDPGEDVGDDVIHVTAHGLKHETYWLDARWDALQRSVDKALPDTTNVLTGDPRGVVLVNAASDRDPGEWLLLDTAHMTLRRVARVFPGVSVAAMRPMQTLTYPADDGLAIPAYLTLPAGPVKPRPMVVFIHGGPIARDEWAWSPDVQILAAAGYVVFQPQFRGSAGFGRKFEQAGYRQWGLAMQDDITAGVTAMIARGVADPARICIYGASYGGYAALWGLVKTPELYRCGASLAGVSDIGERFTDWSDTNDNKAGQDWLRFAVGDIGTMAAQFDAVSPEKHAARIRVPVLLGHGNGDVRVPIGHSKRMAAALEAAHVPVETHWYGHEGHGLTYLPDIRDFDFALLDFLDRNIGPASPFAAAEKAAASQPAAASDSER